MVKLLINTITQNTYRVLEENTKGYEVLELSTDNVCFISLECLQFYKQYFTA